MWQVCLQTCCIVVWFNVALAAWIYSPQLRNNSLINQLPQKQIKIKLGAMIIKYPDLSESIFRPIFTIFEDISKLLCNEQSKASWKIRFEFENVCSTSEIP